MCLTVLSDILEKMSVEKSSEDEDSKVLEITHKVQLCSLERNNHILESLEPENEKNTFFSYHNSITIEYAYKFNKNLSLEDSDSFLIQLKAVLEKYPSIGVLRRRNVPLKKDKDRDSGQYEDQCTGKNKSVSLREQTKKTPMIHPASSTNLFKNYLFHHGNPQMSKTSKKKYENLIITMKNVEDNSFCSFFLEHKQDFLELLAQDEMTQDFIPQIIEVILKIFKIKHLSSKNILLALIHKDFITKIVSYITLLPTDCEHTSDFEIAIIFRNILSFCEHINNTMTQKSAGVVRKILLSLQYSVKGLKEIQNFNFEPELTENITRLLEYSNVHGKHEPTFKTKKSQNNSVPLDVRDIDIFPTKRDLFEPNTFLPKNVVDGSYRDANHYIDVQFRLLREDFIAPLRNGIQLYNESIADRRQVPNQRFDNIRVHEGVKILHGTITKSRFGHLVQMPCEIDFQKESKRFMFGSLVLFTADNFETFFCGTIVNPAEKNLLIVELCVDDISDIYNKVYTMVESEVFFEPYFQVLTALQGFDCANFPMKNYIIDVKQVNNNCPEAQNIPADIYHFYFNDSQKEAFKSAVLNEFVVIQGPPGTGKTYLAEKIAKTLLVKKVPTIVMNLHLFDLSDEFDNYDFETFKTELRRKKRRGEIECRVICIYRSGAELPVFHNFFCEQSTVNKPILVICYTNHALDQFLERLLPYTKKLVRVGGQSKNSSVQDYNLKVIRKCWIKEKTFNCKRCNCFTCLIHLKKIHDYFEHMNVVQTQTFHYLVCLKILQESSFNGVLRVEKLRKWMSPGFYNTLFRQKQYETWLMEGANFFHFEDQTDSVLKPEFTVHTEQLLSEFRESRSYWDDLEMYDLRSVQTRSTYEANSHFLLKCSELTIERNNVHKKLRKFRQQGRDENIDVYENLLEDLDKRRRYIAHMLAHKTPIDLKRIKELNRTSNIWTIDFQSRWMLYNYWVQLYEKEIKNEMLLVEITLKEDEEYFIRTRDKFDLDILKSAHIIGMTTTSAARLKNMLMKVGSEIVIVEEAAECLESHIVVALNSLVKKVILIGDHKQLKPNPAVYELARRYKLDVSLFERMINNGLACQVLDTQHRMRPEIASLIVPAIYPNLKNGEKALDRPDIRGVATNVFFVTHNEFEDEYNGDSRSHRNTHEVNFLISFCQYLLQQDYKPTKITILATYLGQMTALENERRRRNLPSKLRICTVDNYQGEENDIILLSLVRSNAEARIGFLSAENRVCVALSRAKNGLFIIGNMGNLTQNNTVWSQVKAQLVSMDAIGPALPLGCKRHQNDKCLVSSSKDFKDIPISGCKLKCEEELKCGHKCPAFCHSSDIEHSGRFACPHPCVRKTCQDHKCSKTCGEECGPCSVKVEKQLPCGHTVQLKCSADLSLQECNTIETFISSKCGHIVTKICYQKVEMCLEPCSKTLDCGHPCNRICHQNDKVYSHSRKYCIEEVERTLACGHTRKVDCHLGKSNVDCSEPCPRMLPCGHPCVKLCSEPCNYNCDTPVEKTLKPCGHQLTLPCSYVPDSSHCRQQCPLSLPCGHPCPSSCSSDCNSSTCQESVLSNTQPGCGHGLIMVPCFLNTLGLEANSDLLLQHCQAPCRADLPCGHLCVGRCGDCLQGRLHIPCSCSCTKTLQCGHSCEYDCREECPAFCDRPCRYRCSHQDCNHPCGDPCNPCQNKCERNCRHQQCSQLCGEECDCPPCFEPCPLILSCGHTCPGYCGEPCLQSCIVCHPDVFFIPGSISKPTDRYVVVEDCGHAVEEKLLRRLFMTDVNCKFIKKCPYCDEPIRFVSRYKEEIQKLYSHLASLKSEENLKYERFEKKVKFEKFIMKKYSNELIEIYGDDACYIREHLKKAPLVYKTSLQVCNLFKHLTKYDSFAKKENESCNPVLLRRKLLLAALTHRLKSMSSSDYNEFLTELYRLEVSTKNWPNNSHLLFSLNKKQFSPQELKTLDLDV